MNCKDKLNKGFQMDTSEKIQALMAKDVDFNEVGIPCPAPDAKGSFTITEYLDRLIWIVMEQNKKIERLEEQVDALYT